MSKVKFVTSDDLVITGAGAASSVVEADINMQAGGGKLLGYRLRRTAGSGTPAMGLFTRTGQAEDSTDYNLIAEIDPPAVSTAPVLLDPPVPYDNEDVTQARKLYLVGDEDGGAGEASTWNIVLMVEVSG